MITATEKLELSHKHPKVTFPGNIIIFGTPPKARLVKKLIRIKISTS
jgi:hypothetical protein